MRRNDFPRFFHALNGWDPFPWQCRLADALCDRQWPTAVNVPTGCGKTSILDAFTFALAFHEARDFPRRLFYVIDRRLVVDDILTHAQDIAAKLKAALTNSPGIASCITEVARRLAALSAEGEPLAACGMRGGARLELDWACAPDTPALVVSTVDQAGSRLLFQGYGMSEYARPVHAGLTGCDSAFVLDEAHLSQPFAQTLQRAARWCAIAQVPVARPPVLVQVTATPAAASKHVITLDKADWSHPEIKRRTARPKLVALQEATQQDFAPHAAKAARDFLHQPNVQVVGVIVNRVQAARDIFNRLRGIPGLDAFLLTGRIRPFDRAALLGQLLARCHATRQRDASSRPTIIVATQTIEVGANLDFDALVTESAPLSALKQRFGRLNRLGLRDSAQALILHRLSDKSPRPDPIYGESLATHWKWLRALEKALPKPKRKKGQPPTPPPQIDFAAETFPRLAALAGSMPPEPERHAPFLIEAHARLLAHTSPPPCPEPNISVWLHGIGSGLAEVYVGWRADFTDSTRADWPKLAVALPPHPDELMALPFGSFRRWLAGSESTLSDIEGDTDRAGRAPPPTLLLRWDPDSPQVIAAAEVRPGDTIILPAAAGGSDQFGFNPHSGPVSDVAEAASAARLDAAKSRGRLKLRLHPALLPAEFTAQLPALFNQLDAGDESADAAACELARQAYARSPHAPLDRAASDLHPETLVCKTRYPEDSSEGLLLEFEVTCFAADPAARKPGRIQRIVTLEDHSSRVAQRARTYATRCGLPDALQRAVEVAALGHDLGKAAPPFQLMLRGGEPEREPDRLLAKSLPDTAAHLPEAMQGWRHEALSAALLASTEVADGLDWELVRWLAGTSHGRGRPFFPPQDVLPGEMATVEFSGKRLSAPTCHGLDRLDSGWVELFHRLNSRYGWWGLAWLEAMLRLADQQVSAEESR
jgi:CRISPR-associated endonuclease/helicase Cas3